jgi:hypothetical protein
MVDEKPILPLDGLLFPRLFQAFRMAIGPSKLAIALAAVIIMAVTGGIMDLSRTVIIDLRYASPSPRATAAVLPKDRGITELDIYLQPDDSLKKNFIESRKAFTGPGGASRAGVFSTLWRFGAKEFHHAVYAVLSGDVSGAAQSVTNGIHALAWAFRWHPAYSIVFFAIVLIVLSVAGGAICRIAALQFAKAERPSLRQAVQFALQRPLSLLGGPIGPVLLIFVFGLPIVLLGLAGNLPWIGEMLTALLLLLAFVAACAATILLIGASAGLGLMFPAVAYEDSDGFDAINHSLSYVYAKPWHMGFYSALAVVYGAICYVFVRLFGFLLLWTTYRFLEIGFLRGNEKLHAIWPEPTFASFLGSVGALPQGGSLWLAALLIRVWVLAIVGLLTAFLISFYFSANTIIYALLRHRVDGTPLEEVYLSPNGASAASAAAASGSEANASVPATAMNGGAEQALKTSE